MHVSTENVVYDGYIIPKGTYFLGNIWFVVPSLGMMIQDLTFGTGLSCPTREHTLIQTYSTQRGSLVSTRSPTHLRRVLGGEGGRVQVRSWRKYRFLYVSLLRSQLRMFRDVLRMEWSAYRGMTSRRGSYGEFRGLVSCGFRSLLEMQFPQAIQV